MTKIRAGIMVLRMAMMISVIVIILLDILLLALFIIRAQYIAIDKKIRNNLEIDSLLDELL